VFQKILFIVLGALLLGRLMLFKRFLALKQRVDRLVNATLIAIVLVYAAQFLGLLK
jgi:hypothetical protein